MIKRHIREEGKGTKETWGFYVFVFIQPRNTGDSAIF